MLHPFIKKTTSSQIEGNGLIATDMIRKGEIVSRLEPNQTYYLIEDVKYWTEEQIEALLVYGYQCDDKYIVCESGDEKFMNHSCDPNTWWADSDTMIARRDILPGEEITYDYSTTELVLDFEMECRCGSANCRGVVTNQDYLSPEWQAQYGEHLPKHLLKAIAASKG